MRILYFGTPQFAAPTLAALIRSRHEVAAVVTQPDRARGRGQEVSFAPVKALAASHGLTVLQPEKLTAPELVEALAGVRADIGVVAAYGRLLPQAVLDLPPRGMVNVHASLLPRWRGAAPIHRAIQAGDTATGVTIMRVVLALDAGPMLSHVEVPIDDDVTSSVLETRLADAGARLLVATLDQLDAGAVAETPQDESRVTYAARLDRRDSEIDWARPARDIHNQIRAMHPWPLTSVLWRGKRLILRRSSFPQKGSDPFSTDLGQKGSDPFSTDFAVSGTGLAPGMIVGVGDRLLVQAGDQPLSITEVQLEGRRPQSAREFINGSRPLVGDRFAPLSQ